MSFGLSWYTLNAILKGAMKILIVVQIQREIEAALSSFSAPCCILNKQAASALLNSRHASMIASGRSYWQLGAPKSGLKVRTPWMYLVIDLVRSLILSHELGDKVECNPDLFRFVYCRANTKACSSLLLPAESMARGKTICKVKCLREASRNGT